MNPTDHSIPFDQPETGGTKTNDKPSFTPENSPRERELLRQIRMKLKSGFYGSRAILETIADRIMNK